MPRFVVLEHDHPSIHWDFMLESGAVLRTWRLSEPAAAGRTVDATATADHRPLYLDYEGPVSGGRGSVTRWDGGGYEVLAEDEGRLLIRLDGGRLRGDCRLERRSGEAWQLTLAAEAG
jgi:hypothetical protein